MSTYAIVKEDEFIISLSKPAEELVAAMNEKISLKVRNPHNGREDELAYTILKKILQMCLTEQFYETPGNQS
jgi:hypothetical protein